MVEMVGPDAWLRYSTLLSTDTDAAPLPRSAQYRGTIAAKSDYVLSDDVLERIREWLVHRGEFKAFYFLTETAKSLEGRTDYRLDTWELTEENLSSLNSGFENVLAGEQFDWAIFVDHDGFLHVSGPQNLYDLIQRVIRAQAE